MGDWKSFSGVLVVIFGICARRAAQKWGRELLGRFLCIFAEKGGQLRQTFLCDRKFRPKRKCRGVSLSFSESVRKMMHKNGVESFWGAFSTYFQEKVGDHFLGPVCATGSLVNRWVRRGAAARRTLGESTHLGESMSKGH